MYHMVPSQVGVVTTCMLNVGNGNTVCTILQMIFRAKILNAVCSFFAHSFHESKQQEHGRRHFFPIPGESVEWHRGEYLCPLCECYGNTVLPLLPHFLPTTDLKLCRPTRDVTLSEWRELISMTIELAGSENAMDTGGSNSCTLCFILTSCNVSS